MLYLLQNFLVSLVPYVLFSSFEFVGFCMLLDKHTEQAIESVNSFLGLCILHSSTINISSYFNCWFVNFIL